MHLKNAKFILIISIIVNKNNNNINRFYKSWAIIIVDILIKQKIISYIEYKFKLNCI